jgi:hypothetical protein
MTWAITGYVTAAIGTTYGIYSGEKAKKEQKNAAKDEKQNAARLEAEKKRKALIEAQGQESGGYAGTLGSGSQALGG